MRVVSYDVNANAYPEGVEFTYDLPQIYFMPAYHKKPPHLRYIGQGIAGQVMLYIEKMADIKFKYPVDISKLGTPREDVQQKNEEVEGVKIQETEVKEE